MPSAKSIQTDTRVIVHFVDASSIIVTWGIRTFIDVDAAVLPGISSLTVASVVICHVSTYSVIQARILLTIINVYFTVGTGKPFGACTSEFSDAIYAGAIIHAGGIYAIVHISLTLLSIETVSTFTGEGCDAIETRAVVEAWH